jgi:hypothetical protein
LTANRANEPASAVTVAVDTWNEVEVAVGMKTVSISVEVVLMVLTIVLVTTGALYVEGGSAVSSGRILLVISRTYCGDYRGMRVEDSVAGAGAGILICRSTC